MIVEVVAVGTELLLGQIANTNGAHIGRLLAEEGHDAHYQVIVGDNLPRLVATLQEALGRSDAVIITGGIGPTQDDLTREAMCRVLDVGMTRDQRHVDWMTSRMRSQGREMRDSILRMADLPIGADGLPNSNGMALGVAAAHRGRLMFAVPGVPQEMRMMLDEEVLPRLREASGGPAVLKSRVLRCWGVGESQIADTLDDLFATPNPSVAFQISDMEVKVRISAKAATEAEAEELIEPIEQEARRRLGDLVFAADDITVEDIVIGLLIDQGWTISVRERATLGQVAARLAATEGAERVFAGGVVVGSVASPSATADVEIAVGEIGPDEEGARTSRAVEVSVTTPMGVESQTFRFGGDDERLRSFTTIAALHVARLALASQGRR